MLAQAVALYQPTEVEIVAVIDAARKSFPMLVSRADKAQEILLAGGLQLEPCAWNSSNVVHWQIASQSHKGSYIVAGATNNCCCPDRGVQVGDLKFCKHSLAVSAYRRILKDRFNAAVKAREIDLGILPNGEFHAYALGLGHCQVAKCNDAYAFVDAASAVRFSLWHARQELVAWQVAFEREMVPA